MKTHRPSGPIRTLLVSLLMVPLAAACLGAGAVNDGRIPTRAPTGESAAPGSSPPGSSPSAAPSSPAAPSTPTETGQPTREPTAEPTSEPTEPSAGTMESVAYFLMDDPSGDSNPTLVPVSRTVERTVGVGRAALNEVLEGPSALEASAGISTAIPDGTVLLGLDIESGLATVDLSREFESGGGTFSMGARLAQIVFTLTRFETVDRVELRLDGEPVEVFSGEGLVLDGPVTREGYLDYLPGILVESPAWGATVGDVMRVRGISNVFEASFILEFEASGGVEAGLAVQASCGTGCWGDFDVEVPLGLDAAQEATLRVYAPSARDGRPENIREHRLQVVP